MNKELIKNIIVEYQEFVFNKTFMERPFVLEEHANYVFVGLRRSGKSHLMYQQIHRLIKNGHTIDEILYINFEDDRLTGLLLEDLDTIKLSYEELYPSRPIFFLDEIQIIPQWEKFVRRLADIGYQVYVTGSNAQMLSSEIATTLGGRFLIQEVYPYSFAEYLQAQNILLETNWIYKTAIRSEIIRQFNNYFYDGALPELLLFKDKRSWLSNLYQKIFFGDLIARYTVRNVNAMRLLIKKLAESVKQPSSYTRLTHIISTTGTKVGTQTIIDYLNYAEECWLIFSISNYATKFVEKESNKKYYFIDNGLLNLFLFDPETSLLENMVAIQLRKKYKKQVYFYNQNVEIDFYIPEEALGIQVSYSLHDPETEKREINAFLKISGLLNLDRMIIITKDEKRSIPIAENKSIEVIPIWEWLLAIP
ncbi:ATP-binding protein [uncultured Parabacteroides sp.]|jgi:predicted AAA+ superfamily ATPase|uniref:ATP-binding protein n=1 Tax=uncultured Parabacteroides sp. TaxID=512312 RepID=UPI0025D91353|nr:ATP-binding protein [uncultured Parabacteroides sp.]